MEYVGQYNRDGKLYILKICFIVVFKQILHNLRKTLGNLSSSRLVSGALFHPIVVIQQYIIQKKLWWTWQREYFFESSEWWMHSQNES